MPYLFVNFKTYEHGTGEKALALAKLLSTFQSGEVEIIPIPQATDIRNIASSVSLNVFAQHADPVKYGSNTGAILPEALKEAGAVGTVLNHAESKRDNSWIEKTVTRCREAGLRVMLCAESTERARQLAGFSPEFIAVEPPELIGGNVSVSSAKPELITDSVKAIHKINPKIIIITGAGIKTAQDVSKAIELGSQGAFVASGIVSSKNQELAIRELLGGYPAKNNRRVEP